VRMLSLDVGEGTGISGQNLYIYDSDFVRSRVLRKLSIQSYPVPQASRGRALGFLPPTTGPLLLRSAPFGLPRTDSGKTDERGTLRDTEVVRPQMYKRDALAVYNRVGEKLNVL
jgi:hypothetical protein